MNNFVKSKLLLICLGILFFGIAFAEQYQISFASFLDKNNADKMLEKIEACNVDVEIEEVVINEKLFYRLVSSTKYNNRHAAFQASELLKEKAELDFLDFENLWFRPDSLAPPAPETVEITPVVQASSELERFSEAEFDNRDNKDKGLITGKVIDSTTGKGVPEVEVSLKDGDDKGLSDNGGFYSLQAEKGKPNVVLYHKEGYELEPQSVEVLEDEPTIISETQTVANRNLDEGCLRFVLTWGKYPYDLDSHLITPSGHHIYYGQKYPRSSGANLDIDDINSYGPETITIEKIQDGSYVYFVHNYSEYPKMAGTAACVKFYTDNGLQETINIPSSESFGVIWIVGVYEQGHFKVINKIVESFDDIEDLLF